MADPLFAQVALLLGFDEGLPGNTTFRDWSIYNRTITPMGDARMSTAVVKHGQGALYLDGTGDSLSVAHDPSLSGNLDFCYECWINPAAPGTLRTIASKRASSRDWTFLVTASNQISCYAYNTAGNTLVLPAIVGDPNNAIAPAGMWSHAAMTKMGNIWRCWLNGVLVREGVESGTYGVGTGPLIIGNEPGFSGRIYSGYMDDIRLTIGHCRYTAPFTPPGPIGAWDIGGNVTRETGGPADRVVLHYWDTQQLARVIVPDSNGDWSAQVPQADYGVTYLAAGLQPITHGPYSVVADA